MSPLKFTAHLSSGVSRSQPPQLPRAVLTFAPRSGLAARTSHSVLRGPEQCHLRGPPRGCRLVPGVWAASRGECIPAPLSLWTCGHCVFSPRRFRAHGCHRDVCDEKGVWDHGYRCLAFCWPQACDTVVRVCRCTGTRPLTRAALLALNHAVCAWRCIGHGPSGRRPAAPCTPGVWACFCLGRDRSKGPWASARRRSQVRATGQALWGHKETSKV